MAMAITKEMRIILEGLRTEVGANRTLVAKDDYNRGFNAGIDEAIKFINRYLAGEGLFQ
jgi:hypothetical protein